MKLRHLLLGFYVFLSALYPCRDSDMHETPVAGALSVISDHDHSHSGIELDICTPFCMCSCCSAHIKLSSLQQIDGDDLYHNTVLISRYVEHPVLNFGQSIWQPPRT